VVFPTVHGYKPTFGWPGPFPPLPHCACATVLSIHFLPIICLQVVSPSKCAILFLSFLLIAPPSVGSLAVYHRPLWPLPSFLLYRWCFRFSPYLSDFDVLRIVFRIALVSALRLPSLFQEIAEGVANFLCIHAGPPCSHSPPLPLTFEFPQDPLLFPSPGLLSLGNGFLFDTVQPFSVSARRLHTSGLAALLFFIPASICLGGREICPSPLHFPIHSRRWSIIRFYSGAFSLFPPITSCLPSYFVRQDALNQTIGALHVPGTNPFQSFGSLAPQCSATIVPVPRRKAEAFSTLFSWPFEWRETDFILLLFHQPLVGPDIENFLFAVP